MTYKYSFFLTFLILMPTLLFSQNTKVINDLRSRTTLGIVKEFSNKLSAFNEFELGFEEDLSKLGKIHAEAGLVYSPFKFLDLEAKYRFTKNRKNYGNEYKYTNLIGLSAQVKYKIDRLKLYYRLQYQTIDDNAVSYNLKDTNRNIYKNRIKLKYNLRRTKLTPFTFSEIYIVVGINGIDATKIKNVLGFEYRINKRNELKIYYRNDKELTNYIPYMYHTMGFSYTYNF